MVYDAIVEDKLYELERAAEGELVALPDGSFVSFVEEIPGAGYFVLEGEGVGATVIPFADARARSLRARQLVERAQARRA